MKHRIPAVVLIALTALLIGPGCVERACPETYLHLPQLVATYNTNARSLESLWARAKVRLDLKDTPPLPEVSGLVLMRKTPDPVSDDFVLIGYETLAMELFRVGSSSDEGIYYLWTQVPEPQAWWGRNELSGAPGIQQLPIDPLQLLSVLCIQELPRQFTEVPTVAMAMTHAPGETLRPDEQCAYVLTYLDRQPLTRRILFKREIYFTWDEKNEPRVYLVNLFDEDGVRRMTAHLSDYEPVVGPEPMANAPLVPTRIELIFPATDSAMALTLSEMSTGVVDWDGGAVRFRDGETGDLPMGLVPSQVIQVDAGISTGGSAR